ncbi:DNA-directed primase/polymerase protein-like isoform X5 [Acanthaster planci]|uniref:DNA-directed primase/polymerase protein n=1 Tax=Acanthaster planci TaxID=133434 RepID=A0A8B7YNI3_ACAPL|nr:DNA-directed primase/polymerase protein-like isoform X5 [Acanthaster planci]
MALMDQKKRKERQWEDKLKKLQATEAWYKTYPLIPVYRPHLIDPSPFWHIVYRQKHAFEIAAAHPEDVHVFAFEAENVTADTATKGQRKYIITNYLQLWHTIYHLAARGKYPTFYEVIPEGSACKLYFDLEFSRFLNKECCGAEMVNTFIQFVCAEIMEIYQIQCVIDHVINLDATTPSKFSRHLIFSLPQAVFKDNVQAGVYTRNRNFRLYKCIKLGKANPLLMAKDNKYKPRINRKSSTNQAMCEATMERQFFLDSLITNVSYCPGTRVLTMERNDDQKARNVSHSHRKDAIKTQGEPGELLEGFDHSPYPNIDAFICTVITNGGIQGVIRRWVYFTQGQLLVYDIIKNRWCGNIHRQHKSNNIMILVDLRRGVYYQKCHDPDCKAAGYKSPDTALPPQLIPSFGDDVDDDELLAAVTAVEERESQKDPSCNTTSHNVGELSDQELLASALQVEGDLQQ